METGAIPISLGEIRSLAEDLLAESPDPIVCLLLLREILGVPDGDSAAREAKEQLGSSKWVQLLRNRRPRD